MNRLDQLPAPGRRNGAIGALAVAMLGAAVFILLEGHGQTLYADEYGVFTHYQSLDPGALLRPDAGHLIIFPALVYKLLFSTAGADHYIVFRAVAVSLSLLCAGLFFCLARGPVGDGPAALLTLPLLVLGAAWEILMTGNGIVPEMTIAAGLAMLLALQRDDRRGDIAACLLLGATLASYGVGVAFAAGAAVDVFLLRRSEWRRRWWVVIVPVALYGAWRIWAAHFHDTNLSVYNIGAAPASIYASLASATASVTGLFRVPGHSGSFFGVEWGRSLAPALVGLGVIRARRAPALNPRIWVYVATAVAYWAAIAINAGPERAPESSHYQYLSAILVLAVVAELAVGMRVGRWGRAALIGAVGASLLANVVNLHDASKSLRFVAGVNRAQLGALELARDNVDPATPALAVDPSVAPVLGDLVLSSGEYLAAADSEGSPGYNASEIQASPPFARLAADQQLIRVLGIAPTPAPPGAGPSLAAHARKSRSGVISHGSCGVLRPAAGSSATFTIRLPSGGVAIRTSPGAAAQLGLRRFGDVFSPPVSLPDGAVSLVRIPADAAPVPWRASIRASRSLLVCKAASQ